MWVFSPWNFMLSEPLYRAPVANEPRDVDQRNQTGRPPRPKRARTGRPTGSIDFLGKVRAKIIAVAPSFARRAAARRRRARRPTEPMVRSTLRWREADSNLYGAFPVKGFRPRLSSGSA